MTVNAEIDDGLEGLKNHRCLTANGPKQADRHTKTTKAIGECVGRVCGDEMKKLVMKGTESTPIEPTYPEDETDKEHGIRSAISS